MGKLGEIFRAHGPEYRNRFADRMSLDQRRAMSDIETCHTPAAGSARWRCTRCGHAHFTYQGCGNRHCPACGKTAAEQWARRQCALLLPGVTYHLVTFTVPEELRRLIRSHPRELLERLMRAAASTLLDVCKNPRWAGGVPGVTAVLHTWTRQYEYHPHVHFIVTGGALAENGRWLSAHPNFLVPVHALSGVFRARFREALQANHPEWFPLIEPRVWKRAWVVHSKPVGSGEEAVAYLSRYVYRVALTDTAILSHDDHRIILRYRKSESNKPRTMRLEPREFLRRFLQHVLPSRFCKVRYYGLHHSSKRAGLQLLQATMAYARGSELPAPPTGKGLVPMACPKCEAAMKFERRFTPRQRQHYEKTLPRGPP
jgi:hypothetical protein